MGRELVDFVRGTRPRPPSGAKRPLVTFLLVLASLVHLPLVYVLVRDVELKPAFTILVGLLAMGLAWSGGVSLEGRRLGTVRLVAAAGLAESVLAFVPVLGASLGAVRYLFLASALACAAALVEIVLRPLPPA